MSTIKMKCDGCDKIYDLTRTKDILCDTKSMTCNWCSACEDDATEDYCETQHLNDIFGAPDPNQLKIEI